MSYIVFVTRINLIYANVTCMYGQFCDFDRCEFFTNMMVTGVNDMFVFDTRVTKSLVLFIVVTNTFMSVTFVKIALLLF